MGFLLLPCAPLSDQKRLLTPWHFWSIKDLIELAAGKYRTQVISTDRRRLDDSLGSGNRFSHYRPWWRTYEIAYCSCYADVLETLTACSPTSGSSPTSPEQ
jgi:hypothetical protein